MTDSEYFWQDLLVARKIFAARPRRHVDVGSRVDGFIAHLATFREVEVLDIRPVTAAIPGVQFIQVDVMAVDFLTRWKRGQCDSLSCLHALEHFGLGRYGDPIDVHGFEKGMGNMASLLASAGWFYLSTPVGMERVEFNANRVFDPRTIVNTAVSCGLLLQDLTVISATGEVFSNADRTTDGLARLALARYHLGVFTFTKA